MILFVILLITAKLLLSVGFHILHNSRFNLINRRTIFVVKGQRRNEQLLESIRESSSPKKFLSFITSIGTDNSIRFSKYDTKELCAEIEYRLGSLDLNQLCICLSVVGKYCMVM